KKKKVDLDEVSQLLDTAKGEVERLDTIIHQFLQAIRPGKPQLVPLDLKTVIVGALNFMRQEIEDRGVEVKCSWPELLPEVRGDANQLKQAFYNILKNSLQAMPHGGRIEIDCSFDPEVVELTFADTGPGIKAEDINMVFEPFRTTKMNGSGLGLMIVERIIREHGAELRVESEVGHGTKFIVRFYRGARRLRMLTDSQQDQDGMLIEAEKIRNEHYDTDASDQD
ncbi:MAG: ATP-binding protein, partial [Victivallales bacterium]|nr:ATP-binding protein [Victivallales bacterium]